MARPDNYPPGVTGNEPEIAGPYSEACDVCGWCCYCEAMGRGEVVEQVKGKWEFTCIRCGQASDLDDSKPQA